MNVVLIGFMGVGKTSVGEGLAERLEWSFIDTDTLIEEGHSMSIVEIFAEHGEALFRETEKAVIRRVARRRRCVIATGGGVVLDQENVDLLRKNGLLIHLTLSPGVIYRRIGHLSQRPLLQTDRPLETLKTLFRKRETLYRACSDITINRDRLSVDETIDRVVEALVACGTGGRLAEMARRVRGNQTCQTVSASDSEY